MVSKLTKRRHERDDFYIAKRSLPRAELLDLLDARSGPVSLPIPFDLREVSDGRRFDPYRGNLYSTAVEIGKSPARIRVANNRNRPFPARGRVFSPWSMVPYQLGFENPSRVVLCVRRKIRRSVLHAKRIAGRSPSSFRPRKRGPYSSIRC